MNPSIQETKKNYLAKAFGLATRISKQSNFGLGSCQGEAK